MERRGMKRGGWRKGKGENNVIILLKITKKIKKYEREN